MLLGGVTEIATIGSWAGLPGHPRSVGECPVEGQRGEAWSQWLRVPVKEVSHAGASELLLCVLGLTLLLRKGRYLHGVSQNLSNTCYSLAKVRNEARGWTGELSTRACALLHSG
jgi:hypothetical protein